MDIQGQVRIILGLKHATSLASVPVADNHLRPLLGPIVPICILGFRIGIPEWVVFPVYLFRPPFSNTIRIAAKNVVVAVDVPLSPRHGGAAIGARNGLPARVVVAVSDVGIERLLGVKRVIALAALVFSLAFLIVSE
jgi:hypothetical protein